MMNDAQRETRSVLESAFGEGWGEDGNHDHIQEGDSAEGEPTWRILDYGVYYNVTFQSGWYEQSGEATSPSGLIALMLAMIAAGKALQTALSAEGATNGK